MTVSRAVVAGVRFGFGLTPGEAPEGDPDALLEQLRKAGNAKLLFPREGVETRKRRIREYRLVRQDLTQRMKDGEALGEREKALNRDASARLDADVSGRIAQAAGSPFGFQERLASFWLNHFTVSASKSTEMRLIVPLYEAEAIRPNLSGRFADLLKAVSLHPAMLVFLDQAQSMGPNSRQAQKRGGGVNENFGREVMELHTLGVNSGYSQADVRQLALLLTGLVFNREEVQAGFDRNRAEPGRFKVLGKTYERGEGVFDISEAVLEDLASDERTMRHVSTQLFTHFISETPDQGTIAAMVKAWKAKDGDLTAVYRAMLQSKAAWEEPGQKFKKPFDYVVSTLRAAGLTQPEDLFNDDDQPRGGFDLPDGKPQRLVMAEADDDENRKGMEGKGMEGDDRKARPKAKRSLARQAAQMIAGLGEPVWRPSDAAGFKDTNAYWFNPAQLSARIEWARQLVRRIPGKPDPRNFARDVLADLARDDTVRLVSRAPSREAGLMLALVSPEFNRR